MASGNHPGLTGQENSSRGKRYITALRLIKADRSGGRGKKRKRRSLSITCKGPKLLTLSREPSLSLAFQVLCKRLSCTSKFFEKLRSDFSSTSIPYTVDESRAESSGRLIWSNIMTSRFRYNLSCPAIYFEPQTAANDGSRGNSQSPSSLCFYNDQEAIC